MDLKQHLKYLGAGLVYILLLFGVIMAIGAITYYSIVYPKLGIALVATVFVVVLIMWAYVIGFKVVEGDLS